VIANNLKAAGIDAQVNAMASPDLYTAALNKGAYDTAISWTDAGPTPFFPLSDLLSSANSWDPGKVASGTNWEHWKDPNTDKLLNQYLSSADPNVQKQAIQGIEKIIVEQLPVIPLDYNASWFENTTTHATGWPDASNPYDYGSPFNGPDNEYILFHLKPVK
jgi:peptide/nickel transport system substrate-binding protein